jgi:hypothetical protein
MDTKLTFDMFIEKHGNDNLINYTTKEFRTACTELSLRVRRKLASRRYYLKNKNEYKKSYHAIEVSYNYIVPEDIKKLYLKKIY